MTRSEVDRSSSSHEVYSKVCSLKCSEGQSRRQLIRAIQYIQLLYGKFSRAYKICWQSNMIHWSQSNAQEPETRASKPILPSWHPGIDHESRSLSAAKLRPFRSYARRRSEVQWTSDWRSVSLEAWRWYQRSSCLASGALKTLRSASKPKPQRATIEEVTMQTVKAILESNRTWLDLPGCNRRSSLEALDEPWDIKRNFSSVALMWHLAFQVNDISLEDYIAVKAKFATFVPHTAGRYQKKRFRKAQCPIAER